MADNFLEKRMDDLRAGKLGAGTKSAPSVSAKHNVHHDVAGYPRLRVFVTGGAHGIGRAVTKAFRDAGCLVAFCDNDRKTGNATSQSLGARFYNIDASNSVLLENSLADLVKQWGDIDIIVNNVGIGRFMPLQETGITDWQQVMNTNVQPAFITSRFLSRHRDSTGLKGGAIVNISSTRHLQSEEGSVAYSASKGAIASLTHSLMMCLSKYGMTVNCISPGWINTAGEQLTEADVMQHPSQRVGTPEDVARLVMFLAHPENNFINGADIPVDGGMTHKMIYT